MQPIPHQGNAKAVYDNRKQIEHDFIFPKNITVIRYKIDPEIEKNDKGRNR